MKIILQNTKDKNRLGAAAVAGAVAGATAVAAEVSSEAHSAEHLTLDKVRNLNYGLPESVTNIPQLDTISYFTYISYTGVILL